MTARWCCTGLADACPLCLHPGPGTTECPGHDDTPTNRCLSRAAPYLVAALGAADVPLTHADQLYAQLMTTLTPHAGSTR